MKRKIVWTMVSSLMALSLVIASCGPAVEEEEEEVVIGEEGEVEEEEKVEEEEEELLPPEVPKYGGSLTTILTRDPMGFDPAVQFKMNCTTNYVTNEKLLTGDWAKGPAGTDEVDWTMGMGGRIEAEAGMLAESFDVPDNETIIYHIRKGVHWHDKPPVNGREFTAEDAAWSIEREFLYSPTNYLYLAYTKVGQGPTSGKALDKYTLEVKVPPAALGLMINQVSDFLHILPPDMVAAHGDMKDWRNACGTGAFMLADYVPGTSITYVKNPNYWMKDPVGLGKGNRLPYLDSVKELIIVDKSTQMAAFRTGKIDNLAGISWTDRDQLKKTQPELEEVPTLGPWLFPCGRIDKPELPFKDLRVRQALNLAINRQDIIDNYYDGNAWMLAVPILPFKIFEPFYTPLEEMPTEPTTPDSRCGVQELFTYNPEKARQLLTEAGYPNGFKTEIVCGPGSDVDFLSIIREYFLDIGVDMEIKPLESTVITSVRRGRTHAQMIYGGGAAKIPYLMLQVRSESADDPSFFEHPRTRETYNKISAALGLDDNEVARLLKEISPFILEQAWGVWVPIEKTYYMWWPWLQNFYGCIDIGNDGHHRYFTYCWIDEALKESMGY